MRMNMNSWLSMLFSKITEGDQLPEITMACQFDCVLGEYNGMSPYGSSAISTIHDMPARETRILCLF